MMSKKQLCQAFVLVGFCLTVIVVSNPVELSPVQAARIDPDRSAQPKALVGEPSSRSAASPAATAALTATASVTEPVLITVWEEAPGEIHTLAGSEADEAVIVETVREDNMVPFEPPPLEAEDIVVVEGDPPDEAAETVEEDDMVPAGPDATGGETAVDPDQNWELLLTESPTILAKFTQKLGQEKDGHKPIWVTEIGWNSAFGEPPDCWPHRVTEQQQAEYLKRSFDILFSQVRLAANDACPAVSHTFWYQFLDTRIPTQSICVPDKGKEGQEGAEARLLATGSRGLVSSAQAGANSVAWHFGIDRFNAAHKIEPKPAHCAFTRYPEPCQPPPPPPPLPHAHYLPLITRSPNSVCPR